MRDEIHPEAARALRRLANVASHHRPDEQHIDRISFRDALESLRSVQSMPTVEQASELLSCIDFLSDWWQSLREVGLGTKWSTELDQAAAGLGEAVIFGQKSPDEAFAKELLRKALTDLLNDLLGTSDLS